MSRLCVGNCVRVVSGHYAGLCGELVAIHDPSVRDRRFDVRPDGQRRILCFARDEITTAPPKCCHRWSYATTTERTCRRCHITQRWGAIQPKKVSQRIPKPRLTIRDGALFGSGELTDMPND